MFDGDLGRLFQDNTSRFNPEENKLSILLHYGARKEAITAISRDTVQVLCEISKGSDSALEFPGVRSISVSVAQAVASFPGSHLNLAGLTSIDEIAETLLMFEGECLDLSGIKVLNEQTAWSLYRADTIADIRLLGLNMQAITTEATHHLTGNPAISLPAHWKY